jgi:uncharacterized membrane protein
VSCHGELVQHLAATSIATAIHNPVLEEHPVVSPLNAKLDDLITLERERDRARRWPPTRARRPAAPESRASADQAAASPQPERAKLQLEGRETVFGAFTLMVITELKRAKGGGLKWE